VDASLADLKKRSDPDHSPPGAASGHPGDSESNDEEERDLQEIPERDGI